MKNILISLLGSVAGRKNTRNKNSAMKTMLISVLSTAVMKRLIRR